MSPPLPYGASPNLPVAQASAALSSAPIRNPYEEFTGPQFDEWILNITSQLRRALEYRAPNPAPPSSEARDATNGDDADVEMDDSFTEVEPGGDAAANAEGKGGEEVEDDENKREDNEDVVETSEKEEEVENALRNKDPPQDGDDSVEEGTNTASLLVLPSKYARIVEREKDADDAQDDDDVLPGSSPIYSSPVEPQYSPSANHDVFILYELEDKGAHDTHNRIRTLRRAESKSSDWDHRPTSASGVPLSGAAYLAVEDSDIAQFPQPDKFPELETFEASDQLPTLGAPSVPLPIHNKGCAPRAAQAQAHRGGGGGVLGAGGGALGGHVAPPARQNVQAEATNDHCTRAKQQPGQGAEDKEAGDPPGYPHIHCLPPFPPRSLRLRETIFPAPPFVITLRHPPSGMQPSMTLGTLGERPLVFDATSDAGQLALEERQLQPIFPVATSLTGSGVGLSGACSAMSAVE
ncbi:hypothetical protein B0H13DRAFT_1859293 [Mycena leptocephala]|nr:hypothetical protein B0H13DRAFT_1859293 [Mycena leptocephala]